MKRSHEGEEKVGAIKTDNMTEGRKEEEKEGKRQWEREREET